MLQVEAFFGQTLQTIELISDCEITPDVLALSVYLL